MHIGVLAIGEEISKVNTKIDDMNKKVDEMHKTYKFAANFIYNRLSQQKKQ